MIEITINNANGVLTVSSLQVAKDFGKRHDHIVRDIETLVSMINGGVPKIGETHEKGLKSNVSDYFIETAYQNPQNRQLYKCYNMTRDGFSLLVMGFTGKKAFEWKIKYIEAFNSMESQLTEFHSNIETVIDKILDRKIEDAVNKVSDEKIESIVNKAVSETVKVLSPFMSLPVNETTEEVKVIKKPYKYHSSKILKLSPEIRERVDSMIISGKYSCQKIADFIKENTDTEISYMTVSRYMKKYFILQK